MGVIGRQSIKTLIVELVGITIGFVSMLFIYPLENEFFGYMQFLFSFGIFLVPFMSLGLPSFIIKYFPAFQKDTAKSYTFLSFILLLSLILVVLFILLAMILKSPLYIGLERLGFDVLLIKNIAYYLLVIGFLQLQIALFIAYLSNFDKIALPTLIYQTGYKLYLPLVVLGIYFGLFEFETAPLLLIGFLFVILLILIAVTIKDKVFHITRNIILPKLSETKSMLSYLLFSSLTSISNLLAFRIDMLMIASLLSLNSNGVYAKILIISSVVDLPTKIISRTASPSISKAWAEEDMKRITSIYKKSSLNLVILGSLLFLIIWYIIEDLFSISSNPESFENGKRIFLFLAIGKLVDLVAGINKSIIGYSPSYKVNFFLVAILGGVNIFLNYYLIGKFDVLGAAMATCVALVLYNVLKLIYILYKYKIHPFTRELAYVGLIGVFSFLFVSLLPSLPNSYLNIIFKTALVLMTYSIPILYFKPSPDLDIMLKSVYSRILSRNSDINKI